jgi:hypothetical protein
MRVVAVQKCHQGDAAAVETGRPVHAIQLACTDVNIAGVQVTLIRPPFSDPLMPWTTTPWAEQSRYRAFSAGSSPITWHAGSAWRAR